VPAPFQHIQKTHQVAVGVSVGVVYRISNTGLGSQVRYPVEAAFCEQCFHCVPVGEVGFFEVEFSGGVRVAGKTGSHAFGYGSHTFVCGSQDTLQPGLFQGNVVVVVEVVDAGDSITPFQQRQADFTTDEPGGAGYQDSHRSALPTRWPDVIEISFMACTLPAVITFPYTLCAD
jgi:hypothetical protein